MLKLLVFLLVFSSEGSSLDQTHQNQNWRETPTLLQNRYLSLPMFLDSDLPLVHREYFSPARGSGQEPLPDPVRQLLLPVRTDTQPSSMSGSTVRTSCEQNRMQVQVDRKVLGLGDPVTHLRLGSCRISRSTEDFLYFEHELHMCGTKRKMVENRIVYFNELRYDPPEPKGPIRRTAAFSLPVACYFNRFVYSYKIGFTPKVQVRKVIKKMKNVTKFVLTPRNAQWKELSRSHHFVLGQPVFFQAESNLSNDDERLYVHSCYVTPEESHLSTPRHPVIGDFGCLVESKNSRSRFFPHTNGVVRFSVDAFLFKGLTGQRLFMHCSMFVGGPVPTLTAKSCSYDTGTKRWVEIFGPDSVCDCCDSSCGAEEPAEEAEVISSTFWTVDRQARSMSPDRKDEESSAKKTERTFLMGEGRGAELRWPFRDEEGAWAEEVLM
ncbi:zona pellucida sperm-binding protein 3d.2 [Nematolebias whitei]|uniref:zona pellucida sperm-binding protein 3d.2 n=1 Tax=Nematolebias whitei TaxID=451745 RepID=UPI00189C5601|nr:zona pellucida sperm-binding protein 3d.2 [Nematolebias whitei]